MDKREKIFEKALELFIAEGYDHTPLSKIANSMNFTKGGLHHYFKSKEDLLFFIHENRLKNDLIPILELSEQISDPEKRIVYFLKNYINKVLTKDASIRVLVHEINRLKPKHQEKIKDCWRRVFDLIHNALLEMEDLDKIKKMNKTFATFSLLGMCNWIFYWFDYSRKDSADELSDTCLDIFLEGIRKV